ncbi:MAG: ankyrin repeat domain-containing protein [Mailhella sp.]|jgi:ankyrin repeat protein|nr:ankyrin repeat domain-containing protein [Mailhella sp.]
MKPLYCAALACLWLLQPGLVLADDKPVQPEAFFTLCMRDGKNYSEADEKKILEGLKLGYSVNSQAGQRTLFMQLVHRASTPALIQEALKGKPDLNARDYNGRTPFMIALAEKPLEIVELLWPAPFHAEARDAGGTPLTLLALSNPDQRVLPRLLREKVSAAAKGKDGYSALMRIARREAKVEPEVLTLLKERGADFNETDPKTGLTTLQTIFIKDKGLRFGNDEKKQMLLFLALGASPNTRNSRGDTAFHAMLHQRDGSLGEPARFLLAAKPDLELKDSSGATMLHALAGTQRDGGTRAALCWEMLAAGAKIDEPDGEGRTPLMAAAESASNDVAYVLAQAGADATKISKEGLNALFYGIAGHMSPGTFRDCLVKRGADVDLQHKPTGMTPLIAGLLDGSTPDYAWYLLEGGADVNLADNEGRTPLMAAALRQDNERLFNKMLDAGADKTAKDKAGKTAFDCLLENPRLSDPKNKELLEKLRAKLDPAAPAAEK